MPVSDVRSWRRLFELISPCSGLVAPFLISSCTFPDYAMMGAGSTAVMQGKGGDFTGGTSNTFSGNGGEPSPAPTGGTQATAGAAGGMAQAECVMDLDCVTHYCENGACKTPSCTDGARNQSETDLDCGGLDGCEPCSTGQLCSADLDCAQARCVAGRCATQTCNDGLQNQNETDVDCGGTCGPCAAGGHCLEDADCGAKCAQGSCQPPSCSDGITNGNETDIDCGGSCAACTSYRRCKLNTDCQSKNCTGGFCLAPS